jgi:hypothetical protein
MIEPEETVGDGSPRAAGETVDPDDGHEAGLVRRRVVARGWRRTSSVVIALGAASVVVIALLFTLFGSSSGSGVLFGAAPSLGLPSDEMAVGFHGLEAVVPRSWTVNDAGCGVAEADTVLRDQGNVAVCGSAGGGPADSSVTLLDDPSGWTRSFVDVRTVTNPHGVRYQIGHEHDQSETVAIVPDIGVVLLIDTATPAQQATILAAMVETSTDVTGCPMKEHELEPPSGFTPPDSSSRGAALLPSAPATVTICHYEDFWLVSATTVTGRSVRPLVATLNHALPGVSYDAQPGDADCSTPPPSEGSDELGTGFTLDAHYGQRPAVALWAHIGSCGPLGVTNGARHVQLTTSIANAITTPLHTTWSMPSRLTTRPPPR